MLFPYIFIPLSFYFGQKCVSNRVLMLYNIVYLLRATISFQVANVSHEIF